MLQLGKTYLEASRVCGANSFWTDVRITLPLMRSTLGGAAALMFVLLAHEFTASVLVTFSNERPRTWLKSSRKHEHRERRL